MHRPGHTKSKTFGESFRITNPLLQVWTSLLKGQHPMVLRLLKGSLHETVWVYTGRGLQDLFGVTFLPTARYQSRQRMHASYEYQRYNQPHTPVFKMDEVAHHRHLPPLRSYCKTANQFGMAVLHVWYSFRKQSLISMCVASLHWADTFL